MRLMEVVGVEFGLSDPLSREIAFFTIRCFCWHAANFDDFLWDRLATVLARMNIYHPSDVAQFLAAMPAEQRDVLEPRVTAILPKEGVGTLLSQHRAEVFFASVFAEPPGKLDGLRDVAGLSPGDPQHQKFVGQLAVLWPKITPAGSH